MLRSRFRSSGDSDGATREQTARSRDRRLRWNACHLHCLPRHRPLPRRCGNPVERYLGAEKRRTKQYRRRGLRGIAAHVRLYRSASPVEWLHDTLGNLRDLRMYPSMVEDSPLPHLPTRLRSAHYRRERPGSADNRPALASFASADGGMDAMDGRRVCLVDQHSLQTPTVAGFQRRGIPSVLLSACSYIRRRARQHTIATPDAENKKASIAAGLLSSLSTPPKFPPQVFLLGSLGAPKCLSQKPKFWWEVQVSNLRPLQCECSALPLS